MKKCISEWGVVIIMAMIFVILLWIVISVPVKPNPEKVWCESHGGYLMQGGLFSSNNCVFPK